MGREYVALSDDFSGFVKALSALNILTAAFQRKESRMSFVHMPDRRVIAQAAEKSDTANPEENFLRNARFEIRRVKLRGQLPIIR